ncbi:unnamed protein product [Cuscuta europaea]|uniref:Uncharacterized protein n=1 Tax=Cuscuta europaea TaxID=41803 RepID=A0A9P0ZPF1_CUSEU|nr:unnamed protein product [Cuscuta europaea]
MKVLALTFGDQCIGVHQPRGSQPAGVGVDQEVGQPLGNWGCINLQKVDLLVFCYPTQSY